MDLVGYAVLISLSCFEVTRGSASRVGRPGAILEFCEAETFRAACAADELILMTHARYGRMRAGRCVIRNYGYVGCAANVLPHLDNMCSGRRSCEVRIPDPALDRVNPCPKDFKTYLEAQYQCVRAFSPDCEQCKRENRTLVSAQAQQHHPGPSGGYVSSVPAETAEQACATEPCPVVVQMDTGKRVNVTLLDFSLSTDVLGMDAYGGYQMSMSCQRYGVIRERESDVEVEICGGQGREHHVYTSLSNEIEIDVYRDIYGKSPYFMLSYNEFGCKDLDPPPNAWVKREGDHVTLGCVATDSRYHLTCSGSDWVGAVAMCPPTAAQIQTSKHRTDHSSHSVGIMVAVSIGIALVIGSCIVTVGLVYARKRGYTASRRERALVEMSYSPSPQAMIHKYPQFCCPEDFKPFYQAIIAARENDYDYTMEMRPLPSLPDQDRLVLTPRDFAQCYSPYPPPPSVLEPDAADCQLMVEHPSTPPGDTGGTRPLLQTFRSVSPSVSHHYYKPASTTSSGPVTRTGGHTPHYFELDPDETGQQTHQKQHLDLPRSATWRTPEERENKENYGKEASGCHPINGGDVVYDVSSNSSWP